MAASAKQGLFHSLWFSTSFRRTEHGRKKGIASCQGRIIQHANFTTFCSIKCVQPPSLSTGSVTLKHGLIMEDKAPYHQNDRSQAHTSFAVRDDRTGASKTLRNLSSYPRLGSSRKAWRQITDEYIEQKAQYSLNKAMPVEAPDIVHAVEKEETKRSILQERCSSQIFPSLTYNSNPFVQQSARIVNGENIQLRSKPKEDDASSEERKRKLTKIYDKVLVVNNVRTAEEVVEILTTKYRNLIYACDTEVAKIDVKQETPVDHGEIICFSIYCGPQADFGNGKSYIWVDVLDGGPEVLMRFATFFEDQTIKKNWQQSDGIFVYLNEKMRGRRDIGLA